MAARCALWGVFAWGVFAVWAHQARAADAEPAARLPLPARPIERPLGLPRGWTEWRVGLVREVPRGAFSADGTRWAWDERVARTGGDVGLRMGLTRRVEAWWRAGGRVERRDGERAAGLVDPEAGLRLTVFQSEAPATSGVVELAWSGAGGREGPARLAAFHDDAAGFAFSSGTPDARVAFAARRHLGAIGVTARVGAMWRLPGRVAFDIGDAPRGTARLDPGDRVPASIAVLLQAGPLAGVASTRVEWVGRSRVDTGGGWVRMDDGGALVAVTLGGIVSATRGVDLSFGGAWVARGPRSVWLPSPDLSTEWGPSWWAAAEVRH